MEKMLIQFWLKNVKVTVKDLKGSVNVFQMTVKGVIITVKLVKVTVKGVVKVTANDDKELKELKSDSELFVSDIERSCQSGCIDYKEKNCLYTQNMLTWHDFLLQSSYLLKKRLYFYT